MQIWLASQHVAKFGWVLLGDLPLRTLAKHHTAFTEDGYIWQSHFSAFVDQSLWNLWRQHSGPFAVSNAVPRCLCHVSLRRYSPLSLEVAEKTNECILFGPNFFLEEQPQIFTAECYYNLLSTIWQSLVDFHLLTSHVESLAIQQNAQVKKVSINFCLILKRLWPKFIKFRRVVGDPL